MARKTPMPFPEEESGAQRRKRHKRRARILLLRRLVTLLAVTVLVFVLWKNWDVLAPDKLLSRFQDSMTDDAGGWPVDVAGSGATRLMKAQSYAAVLSDNYLTYYNDRGGEAKRYPCSYSAPLLRSAGKYVLLAEQDGRRALLSTRSAQFVELTLEEKLFSAAINEKGQFALLTQGPQGYAVEVTVYNRKGEELYSRSRMSMATEVALSPDGKQVAVLSVQAQSGVLSSMVEVFSLTSTEAEALYTYTAQGHMLYRLAYFGGQLAAIGEERAVLLNNSGQSAVFTAGSGRILGYSAGNSYLALALREYGETAGGHIVVLNTKGEEKTRAPFVGDFRHMSEEGNTFLVLTDSTAQTVTATGAGKQAAVAADGQRAVLSGNTAIVLGLNTLQAYTLT